LTTSSLAGSSPQSPPENQEGEQLRVSRLNLLALNGGRVAKCISDRNIKIKSVRALFPSEDAIMTMLKDVDDNKRVRFFQNIKVGFEEFDQVMRILKQRGVIASYEVRYLSFFPSYLWVDFNNETSIKGIYYRSSERDATIGLKAECWEQRNEHVIQIERLHFEKLWSPEV
jgi:hypothetical protein